VGKTPSNIDAAIVYPLDAFSIDEGDQTVRDLIRRHARKILLVTGTDNTDFSWVDQFNPDRVIYDEAAERPDYHQEMKEMLGDEPPVERIDGLPNYAQRCDQKFLTKLFCRSCGSGTWAKLNKPYPGKGALHDAEMGEYEAVCLKCGTRATDNYNWYGR